MIKTSLLFSIVLSLFLFICSSNISCEQLPKQFTTYDEAVKQIQSTNFKIKETVNTAKSSWIKGASFYSCDGNWGYFILVTDKREYLYSAMLYRIWLEFKSAESFGRFYDEKIKHTYIFSLSK